MSAKISTNEDLQRVLYSLPIEHKERLVNTLQELISSQVNLLLGASEIGTVRFLQGYTAALVEIVGILRNKLTFGG
jgi:hypothetical protein